MVKCGAYIKGIQCGDDAIGEFDVRTKEVLIPVEGIIVKVPLCQEHKSCLITPKDGCDIHG